MVSVLVSHHWKLMVKTDAGALTALSHLVEGRQRSLWLESWRGQAVDTSFLVLTSARE